MRGARIALAAVAASAFWVWLAAAAPARAEPPDQPSPAGEQARPVEGDGAKGQPQGQPPTPSDEGAKKDGAQKDRAKSEDSQPKSRLMSILGREVTNREGDGGRVIDVLLDLEGRSHAIVVEFGGFMGIGSRKVVVDWSTLRLVREGNKVAVVVDVSREQIRDATEYKPGEPVNVLGIK